MDVPSERAVRPRSRRARLVRAFTVVLLGIVIGIGGVWVAATIRDRNQTARTTARFDPPVWAGQNVPGACSGGFYARRDKTIVLMMIAELQADGKLKVEGGSEPSARPKEFTKEAISFTKK